MVKIYTAQYKYAGPDRLDITARGNTNLGKAFAPTWKMVMGIKDGTMSTDEYEWRYQSLLNEYRNDKIFKESFSHLLSMEKVTLVCFCKPGAFCHRVLLAEYLSKMGAGATYMGEHNIFNHEDRSITGDIRNTVGPAIVGHQVNCQGVMGAGVAKVIADKWPIVKKLYVEVCKSGQGGLGKVQVVTVEENLHVANLFGQDRYGRVGRYTDYVALRRSLTKLAAWKSTTEQMLGVKYHTFFPYKMSCNLAGGDWYLVRSIVSDIFPEAVFVRKT